MTEIEDIDKKILNNIQLNFPIDSRPFKIIAEKIGIDEDELIQRIQNLKDRQIIRRIGGNFSPDKMGYYSTLLNLFCR